jgi:phage head maturation protease
VGAALPVVVGQVDQLSFSFKSLQEEMANMEAAKVGEASQEQYQQL